MTVIAERPRDEALRSATVADRPRRIIACDGGGIRGVFTLAVLERIERVFREREARSELVLADVADLFAGTSTGAIIATCLCRGMPVAAVLDLYREHGATMFQPAPIWGRLRAKYRAESLQRTFREMFAEPSGEEGLLGSPSLRRLLLLVVRNASTGSAWPLTNNPRAVFNDPARGDCNLRVPLWQVVRASTAAPTFFPPERIRMGDRGFTFVDGAITPYNNPALIALLTATLPEYRVGWPTGPDAITLLSVGTGSRRVRVADKPVSRLNLLDHVRFVPPALIAAASSQQDMMCRVLSRTLHAGPLDEELGVLAGAGPIDAASRLCSYSRFDAGAGDETPMDDVRAFDRLLDVGRAYAAEHVTPASIGLAASAARVG